MNHSNPVDTKIHEPWAYGSEFYLGNSRMGGRAALGQEIADGGSRWNDVVEAVEAYQQPLRVTGYTPDPTKSKGPNIRSGDWILIFTTDKSKAFFRPQYSSQSLYPTQSHILSAVVGSTGDPFIVEKAIVAKEPQQDTVIRFASPEPWVSPAPPVQTEDFYIKCGWTNDDWLAVGNHGGYVFVVQTSRANRHTWRVFPA